MLMKTVLPLTIFCLKRCESAVIQSFNMTAVIQDDWCCFGHRDQSLSFFLRCQFRVSAVEPGRNENSLETSHHLLLYFFISSFGSKWICSFSAFCRFQELKEHQDDRTETMLKIYEDSPAKEADDQERC